jgi:hypothetical protein
VIDDDEPLEDDDDTGPIRLWPAAVALGVAAVVAVAVAVAVLAGGENEAGPEPLTLHIVLAASAGGGTVRLVTASDACRLPVRATADLRADAIALAVQGREDGSIPCGTQLARCQEIELSQAVGPRRLLPPPVSDPEVRAGAERLAAEGPCDPIPVEED